jgi:hypothetical protein
MPQGREGGRAHSPPSGACVRSNQCTCICSTFPETDTNAHVSAQLSASKVSHVLPQCMVLPDPADIAPPPTPLCVPAPSAVHVAAPGHAARPDAVRSQPDAPPTAARAGRGFGACSCCSSRGAGVSGGLLPRSTCHGHGPPRQPLRQPFSCCCCWCWWCRGGGKPWGEHAVPVSAAGPALPAALRVVVLVIAPGVGRAESHPVLYTAQQMLPWTYQQVWPVSPSC